MTEIPKEIGKFNFNISLIKTPEGNWDYYTYGETKGILMDVVIMQMRAYLKKLEREYFKIHSKN